MADVASVKIVILWAEEVRIAARALRALRDCLVRGPEGGATPKEQDAALRSALEACFACFNSEALTGDCAIVCAESPLLPSTPKPRTVVEIVEDEGGA